MVRLGMGDPPMTDTGQRTPYRVCPSVRVSDAARTASGQCPPNCPGRYAYCGRDMSQACKSLDIRRLHWENLIQNGRRFSRHGRVMVSREAAFRSRMRMPVFC
jgi:hypothetical protein